MRKKILLIIVIFFIIFSLLIVTIKSIKKENNKSIFDELVYNSWSKYTDEYFTTKIIKDYVDPIPNDLIIFREKTVLFCIVQKFKGDNNSDDTFFDKYGCIQYDYLIDFEKIIVIAGEEEINYSYFIDDKNNLKLANVGDGYEHNYYYYKIEG